MAYQGNLLSKTLVIGIIFLFIGISVFNVVASTSVEKQRLVSYSNSSRQVGNTLITEYYNRSVIEVDSHGTIVWQKTGLNWPVDAERLANGNTLIVVIGSNCVIEVDSSGTIVWSYSALNGPFDAERLANGNTLITDPFFYENRVIEVDKDGTIVWSYSALNGPVDAERLANGNTLITDPSYYHENRVIEVDKDGTIVWEKTGLQFPVDAERLGNGNTLITEYYGDRVIEVDSIGNIVWEYASSLALIDAERLTNGNTIMTDHSLPASVIEVDSGGTIIWEKAGLGLPIDAERLSNPPDAPTIKGEKKGKVVTEYEYIFNAVDPDGDDVRYIIDWGDNTSNMTDFNPSGTDVKVKHTWSEKGDYTITAYARDIYDAQGPEGTLRVTIPRVRVVCHSLFLWFFDRFPLLEVFLRAMNLLK